MRRVSEQYPIYLHPRLKGIIPENAVYMIAPALGALPSYVGNTTQPEKRYRRYVNAIKNPAHQTHESMSKISAFREMYVAGESPVMVLIDRETDGNEREKYWREQYEKHGANLINNTGKMKRRAKVRAQNYAYDAIDELFENWKAIVVFVALVAIGSYALIHVGKEVR